MSGTHSPAAALFLRRCVSVAGASLGWAAAMGLPAGAAQAQVQASLSTQREAGSLSRAEVLADLVLWRRAGVDRYDVLAHSYHLETDAYRNAYREYLRLRNSSEFQRELEKASKD